MNNTYQKSWSRPELYRSGLTLSLIQGGIPCVPLKKDRNALCAPEKVQWS